MRVVELLESDVPEYDDSVFGKQDSPTRAQRLKVTKAYLLDSYRKKFKRYVDSGDVRSVGAAYQARKNEVKVVVDRNHYVTVTTDRETVLRIVHLANLIAEGLMGKRADTRSIKLISSLAKDTRKRNPSGEAVILSRLSSGKADGNDIHFAAEYVRLVVNKPWPELEQILLSGDNVMEYSEVALRYVDAVYDRINQWKAYEQRLVQELTTKGGQTMKAFTQLLAYGIKHFYGPQSVDALILQFIKKNLHILENAAISMYVARESVCKYSRVTHTKGWPELQAILRQGSQFYQQYQAVYGGRV